MSRQWKFANAFLKKFFNPYLGQIKLRIISNKKILSNYKIIPSILIQFIHNFIILLLFLFKEIKHALKRV